MTETTRTPEPEGADAGEHTPTGGTPDTDGRDATVEELKAQLLQTKLDREKFNAMEARTRDLEAQLSARQNTASNDFDDEEEDPDLIATQQAAAANDPVARLALKERERNRRALEAIARGSMNRFQLLEEVPEKKTRDEVVSYIKKEREKGRHIDARAAVSELSASSKDTEITRLRQELAAATKKPPAGTVQTHSREVPASEIKKRTATAAEIAAERHQLQREGKNKEALELARKVREGEIGLTG